MNWIFSFLFLIGIFCQYVLLGEGILSFFSYDKTWGRRLISGFFFTFFLTFLVGFPCQVLKVNWGVYFLAQLIVILLIDLLFVVCQKNKIIRFLRKIKSQNLLYNIFQILKENWLCVIFICLFTVFSMANQLPLYGMNYDDFYYIGKITNLIGADRILLEDYYSGALLTTETFDLTRVVNTYELTYGFFAAAFNIDVTFFCRGTMVFHNYLLFTVIYKSFGELLLPRKFSQFVITPFFLFLIPQGYLESAFLTGIIPSIKTYDLWQFQTAMFYGGSVVRLFSIPTLFMFSYPLLDKLEIKKILWIAILSISLLSFSTIFIQYFVVYFIIIFMAYFLLNLYRNIKRKDYKHAIFFMVCLIVELFLCASTKLLDHSSFIYTENYQTAIWYLTDFSMRFIRDDLIYTIAPPFLLMGIIISQKKEKVIYLLGFFLYIIFKSEKFYELLNVSSFNMYFVSFRLFASTQFLLILLMMISILKLYLMLFRKIIGLLCSVVIILLASVAFFFTHIESFIEYDYLGSGISSAGWNFSRVFDFNNKMTPEIFWKVGDYFNTLPYGNYRFFAPAEFTFDEIPTLELGFIMSSNRIQVFERGGFEGISEDEANMLTKYSLNEKYSYDHVEPLLKKYNVDYILILNHNHVNELQEYGAKEVLKIENVSGTYYLVELP